LLEFSETAYRSIVYKHLAIPASYKTWFLERSENGWTYVSCTYRLACLPPS